MDELTFLAKLLAIPSPSGQEGAVGEFLLAQMAALGFRVRRDAVGNIIGEIGDSRAERTGVLLGHMDTVPGVIPVRREGGRLFGRGAVDAKGPLAAFVVAAARLAPHLRDIRLLVIGAVEEESRSRGARHLARTLSPPEFVIIGEPSGWDSITLGYKGVLGVHYRLVRPARHPAGREPAVAEEGVAFWNRLSAYAAGLNHGRARGFHTLDPTLQAVRTFGDGLWEGVEMEVSLRLPPGMDPRALQETLRGFCGGAALSFPYVEPPFLAGKGTPLVRALVRAIRAHGGHPRFKLKTGTSDMNVVGPAWNCPIAAYGPGDSNLDHTKEEHIEEAEFLQGIEVLTAALQALAS